MYYIISFLMAVAPAALLLSYYLRQDKAKPEPKGMIIKIFIWGIIIIIPAIIIELMLDAFYISFFAGWDLGYYFAKAFIVAGLIEESLKLWVVMQFAYKNPNFDEAMDGIVYAIVASLGFACMENILYVVGQGIEIAIMRAFLSVPLHAVSTGIMGYYIGVAKFSDSYSTRQALIFKGLAIAVGIHGLYDFLIFAIPSIGFLPALLNIPLLIWAFFNLKGKIKLAIADDTNTGRILTSETMP